MGDQEEEIVVSLRTRLCVICIQVKICIALSRTSLMLRYEVFHRHQFYLRPRMSNSCLYSAAAMHHHLWLVLIASVHAGMARLS